MNINNLPLQLGDESTKSPCSGDIKEIVNTTNLTDDNTLQIFDHLGRGDTTLYTNFIHPDEALQLFQSLFDENEFKFQQWYRMPSNSQDNNLIPLRRVKIAMATPNDDGYIPYFRFPVNNQSQHGIITPMTPIIHQLCQRVSNFLNILFNHVVVLLYRIHKDKPLDLDENAPIVSLSLGFPRTYSLRDTVHNPKKQQTFLIPSGSLLSLGPITNQDMYHSILPVDSVDNLSPLPIVNELNEMNLDDSHDNLSTPNPSRARISITFRKVNTFWNPQTNQLYGKGAEYQSLDWPIELKGIHRFKESQENDVA